MQEEYKEFDSLVRSMLENAEVKPSRSVWKGIVCRVKGTSWSAVVPERCGGMPAWLLLLHRCCWGYSSFVAALRRIAPLSLQL